MSAQVLVWLAVAAGLVGLGVYGVLVAGHLLRKLMALNLLGAAVFLTMVVLGRHVHGEPDPVTQAMVLTGIVVAVSATAFGLALLVALYRTAGEAVLDPVAGEGEAVAPDAAGDDGR
jgi:multicomponent Na+:H+ antiporter subunit C